MLLGSMDDTTTRDGVPFGTLVALSGTSPCEDGTFCRMRRGRDSSVRVARRCHVLRPERLLLGATVPQDQRLGNDWAETVVSSADAPLTNRSGAIRPGFFLRPFRGFDARHDRQPQKINSIPRPRPSQPRCTAAPPGCLASTRDAWHRHSLAAHLINWH